MTNGINGALSYFVNKQTSSSFDNPFDDSPDSKITSVQINSIIDDVEERRSKEKTYRRKKDKVTRVLEKGSDLIDRFSTDEMIDDFDNFIASYIYDDDDTSLRNSLISLGRKYARDTKVSGEASAIVKAYSENEEDLNKLYKEISKDKEDIQTEINRMRLQRTKNFKTLSDLIEVKSQYHGMTLNIIKERNAMKKAQFDLQFKNDKAKQDDDNNSVASTKAIQNLFGLGRNTIMSSVGGYSGVSGAIDDDLNDGDYGVDEDDIIQKKYFSSDDTEETDGDKFLKYENMSIDYILLIDEDGNKDIIAEDSDGNIVLDYPIPKNINSLDFEISEMTGTATDNYSRQYKVRRI